MDERVRAQIKKWVCFTRGPGSVTSLLMLDTASVVLCIWILSVINVDRMTSLGVQDVIIQTTRPSRGEKYW